MTIGIIELNDAGLRVGTLEQAQLLHESPGLAVLEGENLLLGEAALAQTRLHPLQSNSLFWHRLSTEALPFQNASYRHHADLAYSQLLALHRSIPQCDQVVFALPATYTREQMSLLLGIIDQCPFKAVALVDSAVAASAPYLRRHNALHLDVQLHQCVITEMEAANGQLAGQRVEVLPGLGLLALWDRWAKAIADQFIDQCRFDPLHSASGEQSLYDQLAQWMSAYADNDELFMEVSSKSIKLSRDAFVQAVGSLYEQIDQRIQSIVGANYQLLVSDRLAKLPGFIDLLSRHGSLVNRLPSNAVMEGIQQQTEHIIQEGGALRFNRVLTVSNINHSELSPPAPGVEATAPTSLHLLIGHTAYPMDGTTLYLNLEQGRVVPNADSADCSLAPQEQGVLFTPLGSRPAMDKQLLQPGDKVGPVSLIEVLQGHGTQ